MLLLLTSDQEHPSPRRTLLVGLVLGLVIGLIVGVIIGLATPAFGDDDKVDHIHSSSFLRGPSCQPGPAVPAVRTDPS